MVNNRVHAESKAPQKFKQSHHNTQSFGQGKYQRDHNQRSMASAHAHICSQTPPNQESGRPKELTTEEVQVFQAQLNPTTSEFNHAHH